MKLPASVIEEIWRIGHRWAIGDLNDEAYDMSQEVIDKWLQSKEHKGEPEERKHWKESKAIPITQICEPICPTCGNHPCICNEPLI